MTFAIGSLVRTRGREWVVLPESTERLLILKPLGGTDEEVTGIYIPIEPVEAASFDLPSPSDVGDFSSCRLLRDAVRMGFRSSAGPFRSFAALGVEPRPYQLVPLLMALKQNTVRLLVADDVGVGKTIEACLIVKELLERGEVKRLAVLCPPHLAEQWQKELSEKFHIETELVLSSTATRLERYCGMGQSLFEVFPFVVVSTDFIKADRRRDEFKRTCPELVIVDEAHSFAFGDQGKGGRHQRHQLLKGIAEESTRHIILVTATPHSGKEENFRSLLSFLNRDFMDFPEDLSGKENEKYRRQLAEQLVQRRRGDIRHYMQSETPFPTREEAEETYILSQEYKKFFQRVINYARETVSDKTLEVRRQRIRWWSALALLRSIASSPAAASATLRNRAATVDTETPEQADEVGRQTVLDMDVEETVESLDVIPGSDEGDFDDKAKGNRRRLLELAKDADALAGEKDEKLQKATMIVQKMVKDGFKPIVFCRFIPTAEYVAEHLRNNLHKVEVAAVTGTLPPTEREERILQLSKSAQRVLVATDCLSEGINLQEHFDAVIHYDLSWNPTRHEQREGRVDRFGQPREKVRVLTYYGKDNQIDGIILDVLLNKHKKIKSSLGIIVPVPKNSNEVVEAIFEGLLLREERGKSVDQQFEQLMMFDDFFKPQKEDLLKKWDDATEKEKRSRTLFAQETIKVDEVAKELKSVREAIGSDVDVRSFLKSAIEYHNGTVSGKGTLNIDLSHCPQGLRDMVGDDYVKFEAGFNLPVKDKVTYLQRTHPFVENLAAYVFNSALDPLLEGKAHRCGVIRTKSVQTRTTLLLLRLRFHIITKKDEAESRLLAEDCQLAAFTGAPQSAVWLEKEVAEKFLEATPDENVSPEQARDFVAKVIDGYNSIMPHLEDMAKLRGDELLDAHRRVRSAAKQTGVSNRVEPFLPLDVLGIYVFLPKI
jgi:superfamily II DNA or RNA helicase